MREMLAFAAEHGIAAQVETVPMASVNEAIQRVRENRVRYRMVLTG
jgi:D-arabinose 1-dehydrogenase-like Zn-dependent alcohol dehydrogenase